MKGEGGVNPVVIGNVRAIAISKRYPFRRDAQGQRICAVCGKRCSLKYCSETCSEKAWIECDPGHARGRVWDRDKGICARCGWDTGLVERVLEHLRSWRWNGSGVGSSWEAAQALRAALGIGHRGHLWEAHHKVAVVEGGGLCGLDGYETLCFQCHGKESGRLRRKLNADRKAADAMPLFQQEAK